MVTLSAQPVTTASPEETSYWMLSCVNAVTAYAATDACSADFSSAGFSSAGTSSAGTFSAGADGAASAGASDVLGDADSPGADGSLGTDGSAFSPVLSVGAGLLVSGVLSVSLSSASGADAAGSPLSE